MIMGTMDGVDTWSMGAGEPMDAGFSFQGIFIHKEHLESPQSQSSGDDSSSGMSYNDSEHDGEPLSAFGTLEIDVPALSPLFSDSPPAVDYFSSADAHSPIQHSYLANYGSAASTPTPAKKGSRVPFAQSLSGAAPFQPAFSLYNREDELLASSPKRHSPYPGHRSSPPSVYRASTSASPSIRGAAMRRVVSSPVETQRSLDERKSKILALSSAMNVAGLVRSRTSMGANFPTYTGPIHGGFVAGEVKMTEPVEKTKKSPFEAGWGASLPAQIHSTPTPLAYPYNLAQPASPVRLHRSHSDVDKFPRPAHPSPYRQNSTPFIATVDASASAPPARRRPSLISPMTPLHTSPVLGSRTFSR